MHEKVVQVDGVGRVSFPDSMGDDAIASVIKQQHPDLKPLGEQPRSFGGVASTMYDQASRAVGTAASDLGSIPGGLYNTIRHPIDTATNAFKATSDAVGRTREAFGKGNYGEAAKSALGAVPVMGPAAETVARDATEGRIPEAVGHIGAAYLASKVPTLVRKAPAMADAAMERVPQGFGINPDVRAGAAKMAAGAAAAEVLPGPLKWPARSMGIYSGARQMGRGILKPDAAAQEAVGELPTFTPPPNPQSALLDKIAQGFGYKTFDAAPDAAKATMQGVASNMEKKPTPPTPRPTPITPTPLSRDRQIAAPARVFTPDPPADTSGPIPGRSPTILQQEPKQPTIIPPSRQLGAGPRVIQMPAAADTSGPIPFTPPESWSAKPASPQIMAPKPSSPTISVPAAGAADVVERVEHPPFAADRPFPASQKIREQSPAPTTPERADYEARVQRLKGAFPHETDQQIRARADRAVIDKKLNAAGLKKQDFQSMGGN